MQFYSENLVSIESEDTVGLRAEYISLHSTDRDIRIYSANGDIELNSPYGKTNYNNYEIATLNDLSSYATQSWVSNNFASDSHTHGSYYVRDAWGQGIEMQILDNSIEFRKLGTSTWKVVNFDS